MTITDRGTGFVRKQNEKGVGLFSMEERARGVGGQLQLHSQPGQGTTLTLTVPK